MADPSQQCKIIGERERERAYGALCRLHGIKSRETCVCGRMDTHTSWTHIPLSTWGALHERHGRVSPWLVALMTMTQRSAGFECKEKGRMPTVRKV